MSCLLEVNRLLEVGEGRQRLCERALAQTLQQARNCDSELQAVVAQWTGLRQLLGQSTLQDRLLGRAELARHLAQTAVLRRQAHTLELEIVGLKERQQDLLDTCANHRHQRLALAHKQRKYQQLHRQLCHQQHVRQSRSDEAQTEDLIASRTRS